MRIHFLCKIAVFSLLIMTLIVGGSTSSLASPPPEESDTEPQKERMVIASQTKTTPTNETSIKKLLSGQTPKWPNGTPVTIILFPKNSPEIKWLCKNIIKIPPSTYRRFLMQKAFRSGINIIEVQNQDEAVAVLTENIGAVSPIGSVHLGDKVFEIVIE